MSVKKYVIEVGQKLSEHLDTNIKDVTFRWSKYRILLIDTTVLLEGGK